MNSNTRSSILDGIARLVAVIFVATILSALHGCDRVHLLLDKQLVSHVEQTDTRGAYLCLLAGANVDARDGGGSSVLHLAIFNDASKLVEVILENGPNLNVKDKYGRTPLHIAATRHSKPYAADMLIGRGAEIDARDDRGETPLISAVAAGNSRAAIVLINAGASVSVYRKTDGLTPLHFAERSVAGLLLAKGADVNARNVLGNTPLITLSAVNGRADAISFLLANGADIHAANHAGHTALQMAKVTGNVEIARVLAAAGARMTR